MKQSAYFSTEPQAIHFEDFGNKRFNRVWLRKNIHTEISENNHTEDENTEAVQWVADEVYFETAVHKDAIESDFDAWFTHGEQWQVGAPDRVILSLDEIRSNVIAACSQACGEAIISGIDLTLADGQSYHFSLTIEDQINLASLQTLIASGSQSVPYHADGEPCRYFSAEEFLSLTSAATQWKLYHESYFNSLREYISSLEDISSLNAVVYGMDIPEAYKSSVLKDLETHIATTAEGDM